MSKEQEAVACFCNGFSCFQAILSTYDLRYGLEREQALKLAAGLGGGMGRMGGTCGAVTGAFLVIGLEQGATAAEDKAAKEQTYGTVREFAARFQGRNGSTLCRELGTLSHLILQFQQGEKRPDARRASAGLVILSQARATTQMAASRLARRESPRCANAALQSLERERSFPADCALPWRIWAALKSAK
jgi:C_GCAxxG_C_C family probable redox protein